jgi:ribosomal protein L37AE/L43A
VTDQHRCITGTRCRGRDGDGRPANTERPGTLCDACLAAHTDAISRLLRDYAMLYATIGERHAASGETVKSSRTPGIPINVHADRVMAEIVEWAQRGAIVVARQLNTALPATSGRKLPPARDPGTHKPITAEPGSIADRTARRTVPTDVSVLHGYLRLIEPHIEDLAYEPTHRTLAWARPERCAEHQAQIDIAEAELAAINDDESRAALERARLAAANCDPCNGWGTNGQAFGITYVTGLAIVERLTELHHTARQHLGHTRLRHRFDMPCPNCHAQTVGRDNGQAIIDCRTCEYAWTEREYKLLVGMHVEDELEETVLRPQLDEANGRLDSIADLAAKLTNPDEVNAPGAGGIILDAIRKIMDGHQPPEQRTIGYDVASTIEQQRAEDDWTWKHEEPYKKPRRKSKKTVAEGIPTIAQSSRSLLNDDGGLYPDEYAIGPACPTCNLIHTGECP